LTRTLINAEKKLVEWDKKVAESEKPIADLEHQLALHGKDFSNSSKRPSSDGLKSSKRTYPARHWFFLGLLGHTLENRRTKNEYSQKTVALCL
jgi:hypothetical protein